MLKKRKFCVIRIFLMYSECYKTIKKVVMKQYMVEIKFNKRDLLYLMPRVPAQQERISELMQRNKVSSYVLSLERSKLWMIVNAKTEADVLEILESMPIYEWITFECYPLTFNNQVVIMPAISLN